MKNKLLILTMTLGFGTFALAQSGGVSKPTKEHAVNCFNRSEDGSRALTMYYRTKADIHPKRIQVVKYNYDHGGVLVNTEVLLKGPILKVKTLPNPATVIQSIYTGKNFAIRRTKKIASGDFSDVAQLTTNLQGQSKKWEFTCPIEIAN